MVPRPARPTWASAAAQARGTPRAARSPRTETNGRHAPAPPAPRCRARRNAEQRSDLERSGDARAGCGGTRKRADVARRRRIAAALRRNLAGQEPDKCRLAGAIGADDGVELAVRNIERDRVSRDHAAKRLVRPSIRSSDSATARASRQPSMPPRRKSATSSSTGPRNSPEYSVTRDSASSSSKNVAVPTPGRTGCRGRRAPPSP